MRGGAWNNDATNLRATNRNRNEPENRNNNIGFRCARDVEPPRTDGRGGNAGAGAATAASGVHLHFRIVRLTRGL
jgi:hypothetical protein